MSLRGRWPGALLGAAAVLAAGLAWPWPAVDHAPLGSIRGAAASTIRLRPPTIPAPSSIAGCTHWDSSQGITLSGSTVTAWADTRGAVTLGTTGAPAYTGGRVVTDGVDDSVRLLTWAHGAGTGPVTMWLVASIASSAGEDVPYAVADETQQTPYAYRVLYRPTGGTTALWASFGSGSAWDSGISWDIGGASHIWYAYQPGTSSAYAVTVGRDGAYQAGTLSHSVVSASSGIIIGGWRRIDPYWSALSVRHAIVCVGVLTTAQRDQVHAWLVQHP